MHPRLLFALSSLAILANVSTLNAQMGNDNPTGPAGSFNGDVTTGCSYDPYTGNATRTITDLIVPGAVGSYPLAFSRTSNSRHQQSNDFQFGQAGGWQHSYSWSIDEALFVVGINNRPSSYTVRFPDGRVMTFASALGDTYFRAGPGIRERFQPLAVGQSRAYLVLPDGGKIEFLSTQHSDPELINQYWFTFQATAIIDPYGLRTTLTYNGDGSLNTVQEPAGRWLQLLYVNAIIDKVQASDGRFVEYNYGPYTPGTVTYTCLNEVVYDVPNNTIKATYSYQGPNVGSANGSPLLSSCNDPMYSGPMKNISYVYRTTPYADQIAAVYGQILSEKNAASGHTVTTLGKNQVNSRSDVRGDGPSRTFTYWSGPYVQIIRDFFENPAYQNYDSNFYVNQLNDRNGNITYLINDPKTGNPTKITYPLTASDTALGKPAATMQYVYGSASCPDPNNRDGNNPYYIYSVEDERDNVTIYLRDTNKRVTRINYPDGGYATFTYNAFGQVLTHRRINGAYDHFAYDTAGKLLKRWNPTFTASYPPPVGEAYSSLAYYGTPGLIGRVQTATDARGNATGFQYNSRGQVIRVTHPGGAYAQAGYNPDGTLAWTADENHPGAATDPTQRTRYTYDDYKRVVKVTNPLGKESAYGYRPWGKTSSYLTTSNFVFSAVSPSLERVYSYWDSNMRLIQVTQAPGTSIAASTFLTYDLVGNRLTVRDPLNHTTTYSYDERNRGETVTGALQHIRRTAYDQASNILTVTHPDNTTQEKTYDARNRVLTDKDPMGRITTFTYNPSGTAATIKDANLHTTTLSYDAANARTRTLYHNGDYQDFAFDENHNVKSRRAVSGHYQHFAYDNRNRLETMTWRSTSNPTSAEIVWANGVVDRSTFDYDAADQLITAENQFATVTRSYDAAGHLTWERQNLGAVDKTVQYEYDGSGKTKRLYVSNDTNGYDRDFRYDAMGRFEKILNKSDGALWFQYSYDAASNETQRYSALNSVFQVYDRDALNRMERRDLKRGSATAPSFAFEAYGYDPTNPQRLLSIDREDGKRDLFGYNPAGELTSAKYGLVNGINPTRSVTYVLDAAGNRDTVTDGSTINYVNDTINRYTTVGVNSVLAGPAHQIGTYQANSYQYIGDGYLAKVTTGSSTYTLAYDALGRCVKRTSGVVPTYYVYDGARPILEYKANGDLAGWNLYGKGIDEILLRADYVAVPGGQGYFFQQNYLGSVTHLTGFAGQDIEKYSYDAFGAPTTTYTAGVFNNRFKFTGREYAATFGMYEYRARAYHPGLGRFLSEDPIGFAAGDSNMFRYCGGDPVNFSDPSGLQSGAIFIARKKDGPTGSGSSPPSTPSLGSSASNPSWGGSGRNGLGFGSNSGGGLGDGSGGGGGGISTDTGLNTPAPTLPAQPLAPASPPSSPSVTSRLRGWFDNSAMFSLWASGLGPETLAFGPNSVEAQMMAGAPGVQNAVANYWWNNTGADWSQALSTTYQSNFGLAGAWAADINPTQQFIGSYTVYVNASGPNAVQVVVWNQTSLNSLLADWEAIPYYSRSQFSLGGNMYQTITFRLPYP